MRKQLLYIVLFICLVQAGATGCGSKTTSTPAASLPTVTTSAVSAITSDSAKSGGTVTSTGGAAIIAFGVCWSTNATPTVNDLKTNDAYIPNSTQYTSVLTGLSPGTKYYICAYATNSAGTAYGTILSFQTISNLPAVSITSLSSLTYNLATFECNVTSQGGAPVTAHGICYSTAQNPTTSDTMFNEGSGVGEYFGETYFLAVNTTYYARAYATNSFGTAYSTQFSFTPEYTIGQSYEGGLIFNIDSTKVHGLIVALTDEIMGAYWFNGSYLLTNASSTTDGATNTAEIITVQGSGTYAATVCTTYSYDLYSDWFLPSIDQLNMLYAQKNALTGLGSFELNNYWSSTEADIDNAWCVNFQNGAQSSTSKNDQYPIRAIRAF